MKKYMGMLVSVIALLFMCAGSGQAEHFHGGGRGGPGWWPVVGLGLGIGLWELSHPYYSYPHEVYYAPVPVIIQQPLPEVYVQPAPQYAPAPLPEQVYWYYCQDPQGYYPYVKQCPKGWMRVVPAPPAP